MEESPTLDIKKDNKKEITQIKEKISNFVVDAMEHGHEINVQKIKEVEEFQEILKSADYGYVHPSGERKEVLYTDASIIVERHDVYNGNMNQSETSYIIKTKDVDVMEEVLESFKVPELEGKEFLYDQDVLSKETSGIEFDLLMREIPVELNKVILETFKKNIGMVKVYEIKKEPIVSTTQVIRQNINNESCDNEEVVFTDGFAKFCEQMEERSSNSDVYKTRVTIQEANTIVIKKTNIDSLYETGEQELGIYTTRPSDYAKYVSVLACRYMKSKKSSE